MTCCICMDCAIDTAFFPCAHVIACGKCGARCDRCPLCRAPIQHSQHVFLPIELKDTDHLMRQHPGFSHPKEQIEEYDDNHCCGELQNHTQQVYQVNQLRQQQWQNRNGLTPCYEQIVGGNQVSSGAELMLHQMEQLNQTE